MRVKRVILTLYLFRCLPLTKDSERRKCLCQVLPQVLLSFAFAFLYKTKLIALHWDSFYFSQEIAGRPKMCKKTTTCVAVACVCERRGGGGGGGVQTGISPGRIPGRTRNRDFCWWGSKSCQYKSQFRFLPGEITSMKRVLIFYWK